MNIKFDEVKLKDYIKKHKNKIEEILSDSRVVEAIDGLDFDTLSNMVNIDLSVVVALMLLSGTDVLSNLDYIPDRMFASLPITHIDIPQTVKGIGSGAFAHSLLDSIYIPDSVERVGDYAFSGCVGIENVHISDKLRSISIGCFTNCWKLKEVKLPESCSDIHADAFYDCTELSFIDLENVRNIGSNAFFGTKLISAYIPKAQNINSGAFARCFHLYNVTISDNLLFLGSFIFEDCNMLTNIDFNGSSNAFMGRSALWNTKWNKYSKIKSVTCNDKSVRI